MKTFIASAALGFLALSLAPAAQAQHHPTQKPTGYVKTLFSEADSVRVYHYLFENAPSEFASYVPRFAVAGREHSFYIGIGGHVKTTVSYDWGATLDNPNEFLISQLPLAKSPGNGGLLQFSAQQTSLYLNFVGLPGSANQVGVFIGGNLLGDHYTPELQYAFLRYRGITLGYDKTLFCDPPATPPTIDYEGPSASTAISSATLNYTFSFGKKKAWKAGIGVEMPICSLTESPEAVHVTQRVPDIPVFIQRSWMDGQGWLRLAAIMRNMYYRDLVSDKNVDKMGWGVLLSGHTPIIGGLSAYYQGVFGKGIASYIQDLYECHMDLVPSAARGSVLNTMKVWGVYGGLQYDFSDKVFCSATYSHVRAYADKCVAPVAEDNYRYGQYIDANVFWNISTLLQAGVEYLYGRRVGFDGIESHDNRLQLALLLSF